MSFKHLFSILILGFVLSACAQSGSSSGSGAVANNSSQGSAPTTNYDSYPALAWEGRGGTRNWSVDLFSSIDAQGTAILNGASDITNFCKKYASLTHDQQVVTWATLFVQVASYESSWNATDRYLESTLGTDAVTGQPVYSEGLLQLSYGDVLNYPGCKMNWAVDKNLSSTDPNKTIFNPQINLDCGIQIMARQLANHGKIVLTSGYWSTLESSSSSSKVTAIENTVQALSFCN